MFKSIDHVPAHGVASLAPWRVCGQHAFHHGRYNHDWLRFSEHSRNQGTAQRRRGELGGENGVFDMQPCNFVLPLK